MTAKLQGQSLGMMVKMARQCLQTVAVCGLYVVKRSEMQSAHGQMVAAIFVLLLRRFGPIVSRGSGARLVGAGDMFPGPDFSSGLEQSSGDIRGHEF